MSTENYFAIPFSLLNDGKRFRSGDTPDLRLLPLFPLGAQDARLLEPHPPGAQELRLLDLSLTLRFPPANAQEPRLLELLPPAFPAGTQEPRLLQLLPVSKGIEANDGTLRSHPVDSGTSEPELPQPLTSSAPAQRSGNSLLSDGRLQKVPERFTAENKAEGFSSRRRNAFSTQAEHPIHPAPVNVTSLVVDAISVSSPHPTREVNSGRDTANQSGIASIAETRPVQELMPTMAKHVRRRKPGRTSRSLPARNECVSTGQLAIQDHSAPEAMSTTLAVGGQPVIMRLSTGVAGNATNPTKLAPAAQPRPTGEISIGVVEINQSSGTIIKKRPLAIQEPTHNLANKSTPESREHVSQRFPLSNVPLKKRRLAIQEPPLSRQGSKRPGGKTVNRKQPATRAVIQERLPSRQGSTRGGGKFLIIKPLAIREPTLEHGNPIPLTGGESGRKSMLLPVEMNTFVPPHIHNTRSSVRSKARPRAWPKDPRRSTGGEPVLGPVNIETSAGQQDLSTRPSVSSSGARSVRPLPNRRHPVRQEVQEGGPRGKSSAYKGVTRYKRTKRWEANIWHDRKQTYLGAHETEIQAARSYDRALIHFRGEEAQLNFNLDDYRAELTQLSNVRSEDLVVILRKQSRGCGKPMPDYTYRRRS